MPAGRTVRHSSTWFFLTGTPTLSRILAGDVTYRIEEPPAQEALRIALEAGGEIGLHGSFQTSELPDAFATERARLQRASGQAVNGVRQHFLRMRPGTTQERMDAAGFQYDATWGFADINGFRLGLALPAPAWNVMSASERTLELVPLTWMDRVQSKYQGNEDPSSWIAQALELADTCRDAGGLWCGLWHPNLTAPLGFPGAPEAYARLCEQLAQRRPWFCTLTEAVSWRQRRRSARAVHVQDGGAVTLSAGSGEGLALRDAANRDALWEALLGGRIDLVASDHSPCLAAAFSSLYSPSARSSPTGTRIGSAARVAAAPPGSRSRSCSCWSPLSCWWKGGGVSSPAWATSCTS